MGVSGSIPHGRRRPLESDPRLRASFRGAIHAFVRFSCRTTPSPRASSRLGGAGGAVTCGCSARCRDGQGLGASVPVVVSRWWSSSWGHRGGLDLERGWRRPFPSSKVTWQMLCDDPRVDFEPLGSGEGAWTTGCRCSVHRRRGGERRVLRRGRGRGPCSGPGGGPARPPAPASASPPYTPNSTNEIPVRGARAVPYMRM